MLNVSITSDDLEINIKPEKVNRRERNEEKKYRKNNIYDI